MLLRNGRIEMERLVFLIVHNGSIDRECCAKKDTLGSIHNDMENAT